MRENMTAKFSPIPVLVSRPGRRLLPGTLRDKHVLWQVEPVQGQDVFVCGEPESTGHVCTFLSVDHVVPLSEVCAACGRCEGDKTACVGCGVFDLMNPAPKDAPAAADHDDRPPWD